MATVSGTLVILFDVTEYGECQDRFGIFGKEQKIVGHGPG